MSIESTIITPETATDVLHVESNTPIEETPMFSQEQSIDPVVVPAPETKPEPTGRVLGISKKLTSVLTAGIQYGGLLLTMPPEIQAIEVWDIPLALWVGGIIGILNGLYIIVQGKIDAQK